VLAPLYTDFESGRHCTVCCMPRAFRMLPVAGQGEDTPLSSQSPAHIVRWPVFVLLAALFLEQERSHRPITRGIPARRFTHGECS
jgi:hypothetical protein